jgi:putative AdoMet-dependent methyltransferase
MVSNDLFSSSEFDEWAMTYDASVAVDQFPFYGYENVLNKIIALADAKPGLSILDLGTGTGNLASRFTALGCNLWCIDFSAPMLERAHQKLPAAHCLLHDLRGGWPAELNRTFDRIASAYVFHHFELAEKVRILLGLLPHLAQGGCIVIGDIAFPSQAALEQVKIKAGDEWEEEFYWLADQTLPALQKMNLQVEYVQISSCAGVFTLLP